MALFIAEPMPFRSFVARARPQEDQLRERGNSHFFDLRQEKDDKMTHRRFPGPLAFLPQSEDGDLVRERGGGASQISETVIR
jgi:hypothetical protein